MALTSGWAKRAGNWWGLVSLTLAFTGCASTTLTQSALTFEDPKISSGLLTTEPQPDGLSQLAAAVDQLPENQIQVNEPNPETAAPSNPPPAEASSAEESRVAGRLIQLPRLSTTELGEILSSLQLRLQIEKDYRLVSEDEETPLPSPPQGIIGVHTLTRRSESGVDWLRFGYRRYVSRPPDFFLTGFTEKNGGKTIDNADFAFVEKFVSDSVQLAADMKQDLFATDLAYKVVQVSHTGSDDAISLLKGLGITTFDDPSKVTFPVKFQSLPIVIRMPVLDQEETKLLGNVSKEAQSGTFGASVNLSTYSDLPNNPNTAPDSQLLVYYHPAYPEQFSRVRKYLDEVIDRSARQVFVEGMVLEITQDGLEELGVDWEYQTGGWQWMLGSLDALDEANTLFGGYDSTEDFQSAFQTTIRALIREGKADVLSRPSVLTLNNRQAVIRVGTDIPIAQSQEGVTGSSNKLAFNFTYLPIGILLNIRPRITEDGRAVSMMIDIIVSDKIIGEDLELTDGQRLLASAPSISARRVQTYAMIDNNTPFIIGGLVRKDDNLVEKKVPLLGDIPWLGKLFKSTNHINNKQEVIIVLTPYVITDTRDQLPKPYLPKDESQFDSFGDELFRDSYRIRAEDVFDLSFLKNNQRLQYYIEVVRKAVKANFRLAQQEPFNQFTAHGLTATSILVERMIYDVIKRLSSSDMPNGKPLDSRIALNRLIFFRSQPEGGFKVKDFSEYLSFWGDGTNPESFFEDNPGKALALIFYDDPEADEHEAMEAGQVPEIKTVDCESDEEWSKLLWDLNQPDERGVERATILIHSADDLVRLRRAVLLKNIVALNGGEKELDLTRFTVGRMLRIPEISADQRHVIDRTVARYFFHTEHYYPALSQKIDEILSKMDEAMQDPELRLLLEEAEQSRDRSENPWRDIRSTIDKTQ